MTKQQLLDKLERAWADLKASFSGMSEAQMTTPGVTGDWSVKDILAHVTTWEEEALRMMPVILENKTPPRYADQYGGLNAFNAQMSAQKRDLPLAEVLAQLDATHRRLIEYVQRAPDDQITRETRFRRRLRLDTYSHYPEHARAIRAWRKRNA
ncbi:MAG: ClbS/DfsB family four-helix bundle protein [Anaerolineae bacterium]|nr:ClbS/DfsB family four-helix bundle protein [Anaerolineae bacterium]